MSKKTNPNIFRLGKTKTWKSQYFEKKPAEASVYDFKTLEIKKFIYKFFKNNGLLVHNCKIQYLNENFLHIFVSYYLTINAVKIVQALNKKQNIKFRAKKFYESKLYINELSNKNEDNKVNKSIFDKYAKFYENKFYQNNFHKNNNFYKNRFYNKNKLIINKLNKNNLKKKKKIGEVVKPAIINYLKYQTLNYVSTLSKLLKKKNYLTSIKKHKQKVKNTLKTKRLKFLKVYKKYLIIKQYKTIKAVENNTFLSKFFESLHLFIDKKVNIRLTVYQLNKKLKNNFDLKKVKLLNRRLGKLRKFRQNAFFKEGVNTIFNSTNKSNSANLVAEFIATQLQKLKRHNYFLKFIKTTFSAFIHRNFSKLKSIKIKIKGRLNGRPRAKHKIINVGKGVPNLTINSKIDYSEKTSYTSNGTLGVKIWTYEK